MISSKFHLLQISTCPVRDFWAAQATSRFLIYQRPPIILVPLLATAGRRCSSQFITVEVAGSLYNGVSQNGVVSLQRSNWKWEDDDFRFALHQIHWNLGCTMVYAVFRHSHITIRVTPTLWWVTASGRGWCFYSLTASCTQGLLRPGRFSIGVSRR